MMSRREETRKEEGNLVGFPEARVFVLYQTKAMKSSHRVMWPQKGVPHPSRFYSFIYINHVS